MRRPRRGRRRDARAGGESPDLARARAAVVSEPRDGPSSKPPFCLGRAELALRQLACGIRRPCALARARLVQQVARVIKNGEALLLAARPLGGRGRRGRGVRGRRAAVPLRRRRARDARDPLPSRRVRVCARWDCGDAPCARRRARRPASPRGGGTARRARAGRARGRAARRAPRPATTRSRSGRRTPTRRRAAPPRRRRVRARRAAATASFVARADARAHVALRARRAGAVSGVGGRRGRRREARPTLGGSPR